MQMTNRSFGPMRRVTGSLACLGNDYVIAGAFDVHSEPCTAKHIR